MQFQISSVLSLLVLVSSVAADQYGTVTWDSTYDKPDQSTLIVACSDGVYGLYTKGWKTFDSIPNFPNMGAAPPIAGWNSPNCGKCYKIYYDAPGDLQDNEIYVTGVDSSRSTGAFVLSKQAMNKLTNGQADMLGSVVVSWNEVAARFCAKRPT